MDLRRVIGALLPIALCCALVPAPAAADRAFAPRFSQNVPGGDIAIAANTLMTCPDADAACAAARAGTATGAALNNNAYGMVRVDVDGDPSTANSSRATLSLPPGAQVLFAGLYYGARTVAANAAQRATVRFAPPGAPYQMLSATVDESAAIVGSYQGFVDVTSQVAAAGSGVYTVGGVESAIGIDRYAGWAIVVAYRDLAQPPRNLTVFDGLQSVTAGDPPLSLFVSGFETPRSGPVRTRIGFVTYEGDRGASGDRVRLNGLPLGDAAHPETNFFNSSISRDGVTVAGREPGYENQLGYDAIVTPADDYLANGDTTATIELLTTLEQYLPGMVSLATELDPAAVPPPEPRLNDEAEPEGELGAPLEIAIELTGDEARPLSDVELVERFDDPVAIAELPRKCEQPGAKRIECEIGELPAGGDERLELAVRPLETGSLERTATVTAGGTTLAEAEGATRIRKGSARLKLTKEARRPAAATGRRVVFEIGVRARGKAAAVGLEVCDRLPGGLRFVSAPGARLRNGRACWSFDLLEPGGPERLRIVGRARGRAAGKELTNVAKAEARNVSRRRARADVVIVSAPPAASPAPPVCRPTGPPARC